MKKFAAICVLPLAFAGLSACGDEANVNITLDEATYLSALEDEDLGTEEGDESGSAEEAADVEEQFACSFDEIKERIRTRFDRNGNSEVENEEQEEMNEAYSDDDDDDASKEDDGELARPNRPKAHEGDRDARRLHRHHKLRRLRWIYDADNSKKLDDAEKANFRADIEARCEAKRAIILENFDTDSDGTLSAEEIEAARAARRARHEERRETFVGNTDDNGDGEISREEIGAAREARKDSRQARRAALKTQYDADGDGELNDEEKSALRDYLREWVRGEHFGEGDRAA